MSSLSRRLLRILAALFALVLLTSTAPEAHAQEFTVPPPMLTPGQVWTPPALPEGWIEVEGTAFIAHGEPADRDLLQRLSHHGSTSVRALTRALGLPLGGDIHVFVTHSEAEFDALQPGKPPPWADGTAYPNLGAIFLRHPRLRDGTARPLEQVLDHELVHVLLGRAFAPVDTPRWLQEGVAQVYSGEVGPDLAARIARGSRGAALYGLGQLEHGFPSDPQRAELAYAQSADFVQWFRGTYGADAFRRLITETREGRSLNRALRVVTGASLEEIDATWQARLQSTTATWTSPESVEAVLWGGTGVLILVVGFLRRRSLVRRFATWREESRDLDRIARQLLAERTNPDA